MDEHDALVTVDEIILPGKTLSAVLDDMRDENRKGFAAVDTGFARVEKSLDTKADKGDIERLRVEHKEYQGKTDNRLETLEQINHDKGVADAAVAEHKTRTGMSRRAKGAIIAGVITTLGTGSLAIAAFIFH